VTDAAEFVDRYDGEIAHTDRAVARLLEAWQREVGLERSVVAFTADHGETLMEPGRELSFTHGFGVWEEQARVPLMLLGKGIPAGRRAQPVSLLDVVPTLLATAGLPAAPGLDGRSLLADPPAGRELLIEGMGRSRGKQFRALLKGARKWVIYSEQRNEQVQARRLYDLAHDPQEQHPSSWPAQDSEDTLPALFTALRGDPDPSGLPAKEGVVLGHRLDAAKVRPSEGLPVVAKDVDPETLERLRALGYVQ
jgi:arylsulfatase A-like enzyme